MRRSAGRLVTTGTALAGVVLAALALAGCADDQPGDQNPSPGYTNNVSDLQVKVPALASDPCRGKQTDGLFENCGRYVTEVANTLAALRADLPAQGSAIDVLQNEVNAYQQHACDSVSGTPSTAQSQACPTALTSIGTALDRLAVAVAQIPASP
jgi:outer membrane murein-binding lipoprotein Lpp